MGTFKYNSEEERAFVEWYKKEEEHKYAKPSVTADIAIFSLGEADKCALKQIKEIEEKDIENCKLQLLMIKRGNHPCKDMFALPGGFVDPEETVDEAAERELKEETGIDCSFLEQVRFFSNPGRDPRAWTMTCSFLAFLDASKCKVQAGDDAKEAKWFDVTMTKQSDNRWKLQLANEEMVLSALLEDKAKPGNIYPRLELLESENIAFDHGLIIAYSILQFREWVKEGKLCC